MPLHILTTPSPTATVAVWHITENLSYFTSKVGLSAPELDNLDKLIPKRKLEKVVSLYLFTLLLEDQLVRIHKTDSGKPFLKTPNQEISISHSQSMVAVMISNAPCGIDIQAYTPKINKISKRFVRDDETQVQNNLTSNKQLHLIWSCKEAVYKIYSKTRLDFLDIKITENDNNTDQNQLHAFITTEANSKRYNLHYSLDNNYILVYGH